MTFLNNPIFKREFISTARSWKINFLLWTYLLILAASLLMLWPGSGVQSMVSEKSKQIFSLFFSVNLTLIILLSPALAATSITYERENNTFHMLFSTLMSPLEIMRGKLYASIIMLVILVILSTPIACACALTGGINFQFLAKVISLIMVTAITYGLMGLACSAVCKRSSSSILLNYALILIFSGGTWLPDALLPNLIGLQNIWQMIRSISPYDALFFLLYPENYRLGAKIETFSFITNPFYVFLFFSGMISFISLIIFSYKMLRPDTGGSSQQKGEMFEDSKKAFKRKLSWPFYLIDPLKRKKNIKDSSNPVFVAEMRSKLFANPKFLIRTVSIIFILSLSLLTLIALQFGYALKADTIRTVAIIFQIGVVAMLAPGVSSGLITDEITTGTFTMLRLTLLHPVTVIIGKLKATFFYALIFIISSLFVIFAMAYLEYQQVFPECSPFTAAFWFGGKVIQENESVSMEAKMRSFIRGKKMQKTIEVIGVFQRAKKVEWWRKLWKTYRRIILWIGILLLSTMTFLTAGLFASAFCKTTGIATALAYAITATICIVSLLPVLIGNKLSHSLALLILSINPIAGALQITTDAFEKFPGLWKYNFLALIILSAFFLLTATLKTWYLFNKQE